MKFDLTKYETVKERKKRFYKDHQDGRIIVEVKNMDTIDKYALVKATIFKDAADQEKNLPVSTGWAHEIRIIEKSVSKSGLEYEAVNYFAWCENAEESAIGRALDNAGYSGNDKCSREEMEKVQRMQPIEIVHTDRLLEGVVDDNRPDNRIRESVEILYEVKELSEGMKKAKSELPKMSRIRLLNAEAILRKQPDRSN